MRGSGIVTTRLESCLVVTFGEEAPEPTLEEVSRVTLEALQRAATELLGEDNRVSLSYVPRAASQEAA